MTRAGVLFLLLGTLVMTPSGISAAPLTYTGEQTLWQDTVWEGEIIVDGILTVAPETTLEIRPGTRILFTPYDSNGDGIGEHEIFLQGGLRARGTEDAPVLFASSVPEAPAGSWGAINMMASNGDNLLEYCRIEQAYRGFHAHFATATIRDTLLQRNRRGMQFQDSTVVIERTRIVGNLNGIQFRDSTAIIRDSEISGGMWGVRAAYADLRIEGSRIAGNRSNGMSLRDSTLHLDRSLLSGNRRGVYLQRSSGEIRNSVIELQDEHGIYLEDSDPVITGNRFSENRRSAIRLVASAPAIEGNRFETPGAYWIINDQEPVLHLGENDWSHDPVPYFRDGRIRSGSGMILQPIHQESDEP